MNPFTFFGPGEIAWWNLRYCDKRGAGIGPFAPAHRNSWVGWNETEISRYLLWINRREYNQDMDINVVPTPAICH